MSAAVTMRRPSFLAVFQNRAFALLWTGRFISMVGTALSALCATMLLYRITGSALTIGLIMGITLVPSLLVGLVAGIVVDHSDPKRVLVIADASRAVIGALVPVVVLGSGLRAISGFGYVYIYLLSMFGAIGVQFFTPAFSSVLPDVSSDEDMADASTFMQVSTYGATAIGFALAGFMFSVLPIAWAFYLDAVLFVVSATCIALAKLPANERGEPTPVAVVWQNLRVGGDFLVHSRVLRSLFLASIPPAVAAGVIYSLLLPFSVEALHASSFQYGLQESVFALGFLGGSMFLADKSDRIHTGQLASLGFLGTAIATAWFSGLTIVWISLPLLLVAGFFNAPAAVARSLVLDRHTPREVRGRVIGVFSLVRDLFTAVGLLLAGLADVVGPRQLYMAVAIIFLLGALCYGFMPGLRQSTQEWRRLTVLLRAADTSPGLGTGRVPTIVDVGTLTDLLPESVDVNATQGEEMIAGGRVYDVGPHTAVIRRGEASTSAYFILRGSVVVGKEDVDTASDTPIAVLNEGDFFGEIAALTAAPRTANVVTSSDTTIFEIPASGLRLLIRDASWHRLLLTTMTSRLEALRMVDLPRFAGLDAQSLAALRAVARDEDGLPRRARVQSMPVENAS